MNFSKSKYCSYCQCPKIKDLPQDEQAVARKNLLKYCELDTYAMVKIWQKLIELSK